jgi:hypothetical protein
MRSTLFERMNIVVVDPATRGPIVRRLRSSVFDGALEVVGEFDTIPTHESWFSRATVSACVDVVIFAVHEQRGASWRTEIFRSVVVDANRLQALFSDAAIVLVHPAWSELEDTLVPFRRLIRGGCDTHELETLLLVLKNLGASISDSQIRASAEVTQVTRSSRPWQANGNASGTRPVGTTPAESTHGARARRG